MNAAEQGLIDKIRQLPPQRLAEVEDFVDFLRTREDERRLVHAAAKTSEASLQRCGTTTKTPHTTGCDDASLLRRGGVGAVSFHRSVWR